MTIQKQIRGEMRSRAGTEPPPHSADSAGGSPSGLKAAIKTSHSGMKSCGYTPLTKEENVGENVVPHPKYQSK